MKLPSNYFENLTNTKYRQYLKLLPDIRKENTHLFITLILTFVALSFFGLFAINPTLSTIIDLEKQLKDSEFTHKELTTKITSLSSLLQKYNSLNAELPVIEEAVPRDANATKLTGQIYALANSANIHVRTLRIAQVDIAGAKPAGKHGLSYVFTVDAEGSYENMMRFAATVTNFNRIVTIESIAIGKDSRNNALVMSMRGRQYFKP